MSTSPDAPAQQAHPAFPSDATRSERRRRQKAKTRELAARAGDPRPADLATAGKITEIAAAEHDPRMRRQLFRIARAYHMRHNDDEHERRMHLLDVMERQSAPVTAAELAAKTLLPAEVVQSFLDEWSGAAVDLVEIVTMPGKRRCGRKGTLAYYRLRD